MASIDEVTAALQDFTLTGVTPLGQELGRGAYGRVFTVKYREKIYAAKEIHLLLLEVANPEERQVIKNAFLRECYRCSLLRHPNIVRFVAVYYPDRKSIFPVMMMELMEESLTNYVKKRNINTKMKASILHNVACGLNYLHSQKPAPVIHRDLSPNNILLSRDSVAKISDLGVAKVVKADSKATQNMLTKAPGTADFMPPESLEEKPNYDTSLDVFSYAGIVLHVVNQEWPTPTKQVIHDYKTGKLIALSEVERRQAHLDKIKGRFDVLKPLMESCLDNIPSKRPKITVIIKSLEQFMASGGKASEDYENDEDLLIKPQPKTARSTSLKMYSWYFEEIDRETAELVLERVKIDGCFIVRDPSDIKYKKLGYYSLSVWDRRKEQTIRIRIRCDSDNKYSIDDRHAFDSVAELIEFYKRTPVPVFRDHSGILLTCSPSRLT